MKKIFVKICGIRNIHDALYACNRGADALGFIAWPGSKRYIGPDECREIIKTVNLRYPAVKKVGVFVNADLDEILSYVKVGIDVVQLHGSESAEEVNKIRAGLSAAKPDIEIWKAAGLKNKTEVDILSEYKVDRILVDTHKAGEYGGTGEVANWALAGYAVESLQVPVILAGGLTWSNVKDAVQSVEPFGVDLSSGVEESPGVKDHKLIDKLFDQVKAL